MHLFLVQIPPRKTPYSGSLIILLSNKEDCFDDLRCICFVLTEMCIKSQPIPKLQAIINP